MQKAATDKSSVECKVSCGVGIENCSFRPAFKKFRQLTSELFLRIISLNSERKTGRDWDNSMFGTAKSTFLE